MPKYLLMLRKTSCLLRFPNSAISVGSTKLLEFNEGVFCIPKHQEQAWDKRRGSGTDGGQDLTNHDKGPRTPKSPSPSEKPDNRILRGYCGVKEFDNPGSSHTKPKAHAEEEVMVEDE